MYVSVFEYGVYCSIVISAIDDRAGPLTKLLFY